MSKLIAFRDDASAQLLCLPAQPAVSQWRRTTQLDYFGEPSKHVALQQPWAGGGAWLRALARKLRAAGWIDAPEAHRGLLLALDHRGRSRTTRLRIPRRPDSDAADGGCWRALLESEDVRAARVREPVLQDVIHVLQCLFPGRFVLAHAGGRALTATPPAAWMRTHERRIKEIWGVPGYERLLHATAFPAAGLRAQ